MTNRTNAQPLETSMEKSKKGTLNIIGTGIRAIADITVETKSFIENADIVFHTVTDPMTIDWIESLNGNCIDLHPWYDEKKPRKETYAQWTQMIVEAVCSGNDTVCIFYGHPGFFAKSPHEALKTVRSEGHDAKMYPGISSVDHMIADLNFDPAMRGMQIFEATEFMIYDRIPDVHSHIAILQIGVVGDSGYRPRGYGNKNFKLFAQRLLEFYLPEHRVCVYVSSYLVIGRTKMDWMPLKELLNYNHSPLDTLYIPPAKKRNLNVETARKFKNNT